MSIPFFAVLCGKNTLFALFYSFITGGQTKTPRRAQFDTKDKYSAFFYIH